MKNYRAIIQYDGTKYNGWQRQGNTKNTIQEKIEQVLSRMVENSVEIFGAGRTDAGVHALGQVINFKTDTDKSNVEIMEYLNNYLPTDIQVISVDRVADRFHARLNAKGKTYVYKICNLPYINVFSRKYSYFHPGKLDVDKMRKAGEYLIGQRDFRAFCSVKNMKKSTVRNLMSISIYNSEGEICIEYKGNGFLYNMVRILTGTLIEIGEGKRDIDTILRAFETGDRQMAGFTAPPNGLFLREVEY